MTTITKPDELVEKIYNFIEDVKDTIVDLNETCIEFVEIYDLYNEKFIYDSALLKERMKSMVLKAASNDI